MFGAIIGDIIGSVYEWNNIKTKDFPLFSEHCSFTDDTVMTIAVAEALMNGGTSDDFIDAMKKYGRFYPDIGYGPRFGDWLSSDDREPYNSWGNGSAMRVAPCAWFASSLEIAETLAERSAAVTHNHPEGIKGAQATAAAIYLARVGKTQSEIKEYIENTYGYDLSRTLDEIRPTYTFDVSCQGSVPEAIIAFLESNDFEDAIRNAISLGGDSDTIAAITGSIAEAAYEIPSDITTDGFFFLDDTLSSAINKWLDNEYPIGTIVKKSAWKTEEFSKPHSIQVHYPIFEKMFCRIRFGLLPEVMEDKWFSYYENGSLCFHRSWTGFKIYEAKIEKDESEWGYCITELIVERDTDLRRDADDDEDCGIFKHLLIGGLLGMRIELPFNTDDDIGIKKAWCNFGRMIL